MGLTHILELDDLHRDSVVHPGCVVVPAVWPLAESSNVKPGGITTLTAILHGFEAAIRVETAVGLEHYRIFHNTATYGPFDSAMATLLDLPVEMTINALGNAGTQAAGLWQFLESGAMSKHLHAGRAAEAGLVAADLASRGFTGPDGILEGERGFFAGLAPAGDPEAPPSRGALIEKARLLMEFGNYKDPDNLIDALLDMPNDRPALELFI